MKKSDKLDILYEDKDILVVNKPYGLLTVATDKEAVKTLFHKVYMYIKRKNKNNKIFVVHRLDKDTSGIVLFAKSEKLKFELQNNWDKLVKERKYLTIVHGIPSKKSDRIISWLKETKTLLTYSSNIPNDGKKAVTNYRIIKELDNKSFLEVSIDTGRKNQIRVHMHDIGNPILGDNKYGVKDNYHRMYLHAYKLVMINPVNNNEMIFETDVPEDFIKIINN